MSPNSLWGAALLVLVIAVFAPWWPVATGENIRQTSVFLAVFARVAVGALALSLAWYAGYKDRR